MGDDERVTEKMKGRGHVALILAIFISCIVWVVLGSLLEDYVITFFLSFLILFGLSFIFSKITYRLSSEEEKRIYDEIDKENKDKKKNFEVIKNDNPNLQHIRYVSGILGITEQTGHLIIESENLCFYNPFKFEKNFELPIRQIKNIVYDLSTNITLGRVLLFGLGSLVMKKKTYYLIIEFTSERGINNQLVFDTSNKKDIIFYNALMLARNKYGEPSDAHRANSIIEQVKKLAKLKGEGLITEVEYLEKKKALLDKII